MSFEFIFNPGKPGTQVLHHLAPLTCRLAYLAVHLMLNFPYLLPKGTEIPLHLLKSGLGIRQARADTVEPTSECIILVADGGIFSPKTLLLPLDKG